MLDDYVLFQTSPSLRSVSSIPRGFATDVGAVRKGSATALGSYYRPLFLALSTLFYQVVGGRPAAWHLASVALAGLIGALAYLLFRRLGVSAVPALLASAVFSLHPAHVSSVAWAAGLQELLAACLVLLAVHALLWRPGPSADRVTIAASTIGFALALLSKEVAIGLVPLVAIWAWTRRATDPAETRRFARAAAVFAGVSLFYLVVRMFVFGGLAKPWPQAPGFAASLPSVPVAFVSYLRLLVWPTEFSFFRPERPTAGWLDAPVLTSLLILVVLGLLAYLAIRRRRALLLPIGWLVVWLLPVLNLWALDPQLMVTDRYLFLPALALPWLLVLWWPGRASVAALALVLLAFAGLSLRYSAIFADERTFLAAMEKAQPTSALIFAEKGRLLIREGKAAEAEAALTRAVDLNPHDATSWLRLGDLALQRGDLATAEGHFRHVLVDEPHASRPFKVLAIALARAGQLPQATALLEESARRWPADFEVQLLHALMLGRSGQRPEAERAFENARRLRPWAPELAGGLDGALSQMGPAPRSVAPSVPPDRR